MLITYRVGGILEFQAPIVTHSSQGVTNAIGFLAPRNPASPVATGRAPRPHRLHTHPAFARGMRRFAILIVCALLAVVVPVTATHGGVYFNYTGPGTVFGGPGDTATYKLDARNSGATAESITIAVTSLPPGWTATLEFTSLTLAPGERKIFELAVVPDVLPLLARVYVAATVDSTGGVIERHVTHYHLIAPTLMFDQSEFSPLEPVTGVARLKFANGAGAPSATGDLQERWGGVGLARALSGVTNAAGEWAFAFPVDPAGSNTPGRHIAELAFTYGGSTFEAKGEYWIL